jgi:hypothetical protein
MSATALAPAPGLAAPAGPWKKLSDAMTAEVPAIAGRPVPVACAPGAGLGNPASRSSRSTASSSERTPTTATPPAPPTASATRSPGEP